MKFKKDRKRKKKAPGMKDRFHMHTFKLNENHITPETNTIQSKIHMNMVTGRSHVEINGEIIQPSDFTIAYQRTGKAPKKIIQIPDDGSSGFLEDYMKKYDLIIAIDTNSTIIANKHYHVGFCIQPVLSYKDKSIIDIVPLKQPTLVLFGEIDKPENRNIKYLIEFLNTRDFKSLNLDYEKMKIGIITDSDLGNIPDFNNQTLPLIDDFYLPKQFKLIYASDASSDTILNSLIKECHKYSNYMINLARPELEKLNN